MLSWFPTRELGEDLFREPIAKMKKALKELEDEGLPLFELFEKNLFNSLIGFLSALTNPQSLNTGAQQTLLKNQAVPPSFRQ